MKHFHQACLVTICYSYLVGCTTQPVETPLNELVSILDTVAENPLQTESLCAKVVPSEAQRECILVGVENMDQKDSTTAISLCSSLKDIEHGECWFRLAERHDNAAYCEKATPFDLDCSLHLLSRWLFRHPNASWDEMVTKSFFYGIDPTSKEGETVLYRHLVSLHRPMQLDVCAHLPNPEHCELAATSVYRDRLRFSENQGTFPCILDAEHPLAHSNQPSLLLIYTEFNHAICTD